VSDPESFDAVIRRAFEKHPSASVTETETSAIVDEGLSDLRLRGRLARTDRTVGAPERGALPRGFTAVDRTAARQWYWGPAVGIWSAATRARAFATISSERSTT